MRVARKLGNALLWVLAILGVLSGTLFVAGRVGAVQPVVVVSGSMSPAIRTGDLLLATRTPIEEVRLGLVATLRSAHTEKFVTHRVVELEHRGDHYAVRMQGDANSVVDDEVYLVPLDAEIWQPRLNIPQAGTYATAISRPAVSIPALIAIGALIAIFAIPPPRGKHERATAVSRKKVAV